MAIFLITAPSGTGKTTIMNNIVSRSRVLQLSISECISHTTRPMRDGEVEGKTYYYINEQKFQTIIDNDEFAEKVEYDGHKYGIHKHEIRRVLNNKQHIYIIVNYDGYVQVKKAYPDAVGIFLHMSKEDCLANMLLRGDKLDKAMKRISTYEDEMKDRSDYDYVIKNVRDKAHVTEDIIIDIIHQYSGR